MFPQTGFNSPTRFEADVYDCEVWGKIPTDIEGNFYRMQCDFEYRPPQNEWPTGFNGDGHISRFRFKDGSVDFRSRYVKTARLMAERAAHKRLYGVYRNHFTDDPSVENIAASAANTHLYWHGGKLLALKEDSLPWAMDPHTLETQGEWDFNGKYTATRMSAHPKIDPVTGEMIAYGYQAKGDLTDDIASYIIGKDGEIKHEVWFKSPYIGHQARHRDHAEIHAHSRHRAHHQPRAAEVRRADVGMERRPADDDRHPAARRGNGKDVRWFKGPARNTLHFLNATEHKDGKITMELPVSSGERDPSQIRRWTFDMKSRKKDAFQEDVVSTANGVLPRMDDRYLSLDYRYCYVGSRDPTPWRSTRRAPAAWAVHHQRTCSGWTCAPAAKQGTFYVEPVQSLQETCFVPRKGGKAEGDGYVMAIASNYESMSTDLVIVDAQRIEEGVIATVKLPFRLRSGTHTNWFGAGELPPFAPEG